MFMATTLKILHIRNSNLIRHSASLWACCCTKLNLESKYDSRVVLPQNKHRMFHTQCCDSQISSSIEWFGTSQHICYRHISSTKITCGKVKPFLLSDIGEGIAEVVIKEWFVEEGEHVEQFDQICEVQSDKASVTITSRYDGIVRKRHYAVDATARVGMPLVDIELDDGATESVAQDQVDDVQGSNLTQSEHSSDDSDSDSETYTRSESSTGKVLAAPAVRRIAAENKIPLQEVIGTGKDGRVMKEDILQYIQKMQAAKVSKQQPIKSMPKSQIPKPPAVPKPHSTQPAQLLAEDQVLPLKGIRKAMAKYMVEALQIPHFGYNDEVEMSELIKLRKQLKGSSLLNGVPFSYMPVIIKATSVALQQFPILNSSLDSTQEQLNIKASHNIGFAMDSPGGLIVPNIKNVQNLSIVDIAIEMQRLMELGETGHLSQSDITGGTFSLSNIGSIGGTYASPVIMPPEVAIGALGKIQKVPRFDEEDNVVAAHIMNVSWSADHRVIEGAQMSRFSNLWKSYLENPAWLILNMKALHHVTNKTTSGQPVGCGVQELWNKFTPRFYCKVRAHNSKTCKINVKIRNK